MILRVGLLNLPQLIWVLAFLFIQKMVKHLLQALKTVSYIYGILNLVVSESEILEPESLRDVYTENLRFLDSETLRVCKSNILLV